MKIRVGMIGLNEVQSKISKLPDQLKVQLDDVIERRALMMVNDTKLKTPVETGTLVNSIDILERKPLTRTYGTNVVYARRQEYEHKTKKGFFRRTVAKHRPLFFADVRNFLNNWLGRR